MTRDGWDLEGRELERRSYELPERGNRSRSGREGCRDRNDVCNGEGEDAEGDQREGDATAAKRKQAEAISGQRTCRCPVRSDVADSPRTRPPSGPLRVSACHAPFSPSIGRSAHLLVRRDPSMFAPETVSAALKIDAVSDAIESSLVLVTGVHETEPEPRYSPAACSGVGDTCRRLGKMRPQVA